MPKDLTCISVAIFVTILVTRSKSETIYKIGDNGINARPIEFLFNGESRLTGELGVSLPSAIGPGNPVACTPPDPSTQCYSYGDYANLTITDVGDYCANIEWTSVFARRLEDCFNVGSDEYIYGASGENQMYWPINPDAKNESAYITGGRFGCIIENYWLFSKGAVIHANEENPLFVSWNTTHPNQICLISSDIYPYSQRAPLSLRYTVCVGENVKTTHVSHFPKFYQKPSSLPDETMLLYPYFSTWAQYKRDVNQSIVIDFAQQIVSRGFEASSHIQIDDNWETCYGEGAFDPIKFPDPAEMVRQVKTLNLRVTLWFHPFINFECEMFVTALQAEYLVKDGKGKAGISSWWVGDNTGSLDVTNPAALAWWLGRLAQLEVTTGIEGFKFDAGEITYLPYSILLTGNQNLVPNLYTTKAVEAYAGFGKLVEARVGRLNQGLPMFFRMNDKRSLWGYQVGLKSMIPTALQFGIIGYPFVLPDMIGGNAYDEGWPSKELYIRWMQVNVFMPAVQFSIVPWDDHFDDETVEICKRILAIRNQYQDEILNAASQAVAEGWPINRPIWWVDPTDPVTFTIDQAYMLGDNILVAPVVEEGATSVDIYLPDGSWISGVTNVTHLGPGWLRNYSAPLDIIPYFVKTN
ncbi:myogenesis-regulating glycosidase isoform X2 [Folsomia candida]|uniref:myogenesis-regulating glycosidase isoform X2 n=1 Tax=Folsomia candida TaxID=158441 RepID=UPI000B8FC2F3|nr:myogenesis-regulating glycosidase isoform X2 [Folsomia candida]